LLELAFVDPRTHGGIALGIQIDHQHTLAYPREPGRQIDCGGGFTHTAFLIGNTKNLGHAVGCARVGGNQYTNDLLGSMAMINIGSTPG
jgi:hypothetical protein